MSKFSIDVPFEIEGTEVIFDVSYTIHPGTPGRMYLSNGDPGWPPEGPELEILDMKMKDGEPVPSAIYNAFVNGEFIHNWIFENHVEPEPPE